MLKLLVASAGALSLCACATITRGTTQVFEVRTTPIGARVETSNGLFCEATPCTFPGVARNANFEVTVTKPGYKTVVTKITNHTSGDGGMGMAGNVILGGLIGAVVDGSNGSMQDLIPNPLELTLEPETASAPGARAGAPAGFQPSPTTEPGAGS